MCRNLVPPIAPRREQWPMTAQAGSASSSLLDALSNERSALRQQLRNKRRGVPRAQRRIAAKQLAILFDRHRLLKPGLRIAVYLAMPDEFDLSDLIARAQARHCTLYVPHIAHALRRQMNFIPLDPNAVLARHRWGIPQLQHPTRQSISVRQLDRVLVPTVAFDKQGNRLGMGAGFYDRHFACLRLSRWHRPHLIGVAYTLQQVERIPHSKYDVPLRHVMTEDGLIDCTGHQR